MVPNMETLMKPPQKAKVKVALFLEASVARDLKTRTETAGLKGLSEFVTRLLAQTRKKPI
jgi:hypothetical protein